MLVDDLEVRVISQDGEFLRHLTLDPCRDYQPKDEGRLRCPDTSGHDAPDTSGHDAPTHHKGGGKGIRTLEGLAPLTVFKTVAFVRSAIPPARV